MTTLIYDNTFQGFLTAVFEVYEYRHSDVCIVPQCRPQGSLFGGSRVVECNDDKAARVWKGISKHISHAAMHDIYKVFLSELPGMEDKLLQYIQYTFEAGDVSKDFSDTAVMYIADITRKVHREKHRMEAFVRFRLAADNLYYATIEPDFNVLPLIADHFEKRYADQRWLIYDLHRGYGIYYDLNTVSAIEMDTVHMLADRSPAASALHEDEAAYEHLWQNYFKSVNIASRKNPKLHRQHMPLRYWRYLTEKLG